MQPATSQTEFKPWAQLSERERDAFFYGPEYLPLSASHAERISALKGIKAVEFSRLALRDVPGYSISAKSEFQREEHRLLRDSWSERGIQETRQWLHGLGVEYKTGIYLVYHELVVSTDWKMLVRYWDAFANNVGVEMVALDSTKTWTCSFHHEDVITFRSYQ